MGVSHVDRFCLCLLIMDFWSSLALFMPKIGLKPWVVAQVSRTLIIMTLCAHKYPTVQA